MTTALALGIVALGYVLTGIGVGAAVLMLRRDVPAADRRRFDEEVGEAYDVVDDAVPALVLLLSAVFWPRVVHRLWKGRAR